MSHDTTIKVRLPLALKRKLERHCEDTGLTVSAVVRCLIARQLRSLTPSACDAGGTDGDGGTIDPSGDDTDGVA